VLLRDRVRAVRNVWVIDGIVGRSSGSSGTAFCGVLWTANCTGENGYQGRRAPEKRKENEGGWRMSSELRCGPRVIDGGLRRHLATVADLSRRREQHVEQNAESSRVARALIGLFMVPVGLLFLRNPV
jgi:hypothetical protein